MSEKQGGKIVTVWTNEEIAKNHTIKTEWIMIQDFWDSMKELDKKHNKRLDLLKQNLQKAFCQVLSYANPIPDKDCGCNNCKTIDGIFDLIKNEVFGKDKGVGD